MAGTSVRAVAVEWHGDAAVTLTYRTDGGEVAQRLVYRSDEAVLDVESSDEPWRFDVDGALFRLVAEAHRIRLAYLFDPRLAVHLSLQARANGWSRAVLAFQISTEAHTRLGAAPTNFSAALPGPESDLAREMVKDPHIPPTEG